MSIVPRFASLSSKDGVTSSGASISGWSWVNEPVGITSKNAFNKLGLAEQINTTADKSDRLWYSVRYTNLSFVYCCSIKQELFSFLCPVINMTEMTLTLLLSALL